MPKMRFHVVVKQGVETLADVKGREDVITTDTLSVEDVQRIPDVEAFLERLTGLRFHIEQLHENE